jgi:hypothetical protein
MYLIKICAVSLTYGTVDFFSALFLPPQQALGMVRVVAADQYAFGFALPGAYLFFLGDLDHADEADFGELEGVETVFF